MISKSLPSAAALLKRGLHQFAAEEDRFLLQSE